MKHYQYPVVLTIAGSDSGGGAGIQADLKTFSALGCFGTSAITAITVQNTLGVSGIHGIPIEILTGQIQAVMSDLQPLAIKIGMLHSADVVQAVAGELKKYPEIPVVLDPVMVASSGDKLMEDATVQKLKEVLFPLATIVTPNLDEAEILAGMPVLDKAQMIKAGEMMLQIGCQAVLVKGGHLAGNRLYDCLLQKGKNPEVYASPLINTNNTHGTGCTLSSAIAAYMALQYPLNEAVKLSIDYIKAAIEAGKDVKTGQGKGPLNHFFSPKPLIKHALKKIIYKV